MTSPDQLAKIHEERMERARSRSVLILTPVARDPVVEYTASLASTLLALPELGIKVSFQFVIGGSVVEASRNELLAYFLASDFTDALFIDDDMQWSPNDVIRLLASDKPVIAGVGRKRCPEPNSDPRVWCWRPTGPDGLTQDDMGAIEVAGVGAAFLLINRGILVDMLNAHPEWGMRSPADWPEKIKPYHYEMFRQETRNGQRISEDYVFCNRVREHGGKVWIDPSITLGHVGKFNFRGSVQEVLTPCEL